jgi:hypothetical protein
MKYTNHLIDPVGPVNQSVGKSSDDNIVQDNPLCTHNMNADYTCSTRYSSCYRSTRAFEGPRWSWSSKKLYHSDFALPWINVTFKHLTKVVKISFQGKFQDQADDECKLGVVSLFFGTMISDFL